MRPMLLVSLLGLATLGGASAALAQAIEPGKEGELAKFLPPASGARICYSRVYDSAHLKKHPKQQVTEMEFRLTYYTHEPDEFFPKGQRNYYFALLAKLRGQAPDEPLIAEGECSPTQDGKSIFCGVECDGGGVIVTRRDGGKILVDLAEMGRLRMTAGCDESDAVELTPGEDDKNFLLSKAAESSCPVYEDW